MKGIRQEPLRDWLSERAGDGVYDALGDPLKRQHPAQRAQDYQVRTVNGYRVDTRKLEIIYDRTLDRDGPGQLLETVYRTGDPDTFVLYRRVYGGIKKTLSGALRRLDTDNSQSNRIGAALFWVGLLMTTFTLTGIAALYVAGELTAFAALGWATASAALTGSGVGVEYAATPAEARHYVEYKELSVIESESELRQRVNERGSERSLPERFRPQPLPVEQDNETIE